MWQCVEVDYSTTEFVFFPTNQWRLFIIISRASKWGTLKSAGNPRCAVHAEIHLICTARPRPGPAAGVRVSPTSDTCQSVAILMNRRHSLKGGVLFMYSYSYALFDTRWCSTRRERGWSPDNHTMFTTPPVVNSLTFSSSSESTIAQWCHAMTSCNDAMGHVRTPFPIIPGANFTCKLTWIGREGRTCTSRCIGREGRTCTSRCIGREGRTCTSRCIGREGRTCTFTCIGREGRQISSKVWFAKGLSILLCSETMVTGW